MARTQGHGNPDWTRDETILALSLYFECGESVPARNDPRILQLSSLLRGLPYHAEAARKPTFRNPDGVGFKLHNLRSVATGKGLGNTSQMDRTIWSEFAADKEGANELARLIRIAVATETVKAEILPEESADEFYEGRVLTETHKRRERHPGVRKALLNTRRKAGSLTCDLCGKGPMNSVAGLDDAEFEAHHLVSLALAVARKTRVRDMALLCANCHRIVHRLISRQKVWLSLEECRGLLDAAAKQN